MCSKDTVIDLELNSSVRMLEDVKCREKLVSNSLMLNKDFINTKEFVSGIVSSMIMGIQLIELPLYQISKKLDATDRADINISLKDVYQSVDFNHPIFVEKLVPIIIKYLKSRRSLTRVISKLRAIATKVIFSIDRNPIVKATTNFNEYNIAYGLEVNRLLGTVFDCDIIDLARYYNFTTQEYCLKFYLDEIDKNQNYSYDFSSVEDSDPEVDTTDEDYLMILKVDDQIKNPIIYRGVKRYAQRNNYSKILDYLDRME